MPRPVLLAYLGPRGEVRESKPALNTKGNQHAKLVCLPKAAAHHACFSRGPFRPTGDGTAVTHLDHARTPTKAAQTMMRAH